MILVGGFAFGLVVGYLSWHAVFPEEGKSELTIRTVSAFIGSVGGAAVMLLFPAQTDLFATYACGLAVGFFFTPLQRSIYRMIDSKARKRTLEQKKAQKEVQEGFRFADKYINANYETILLLVSQKFRESPLRVLTVQDFPELPVSVLTKIQIQRKLALNFPELFYYDDDGLHMREEAIHNPRNPFLADPQKLRSILSSDKPPATNS
jgi:hypothetical protein